MQAVRQHLPVQDWDLETVIFTVSVDSIALMPCNPNIGGSSKGHLVRELDALGGEMGKVIDKTFIQSKMLNVSKGPAVHSLRAQADKAEYSQNHASGSGKYRSFADCAGRSDVKFWWRMEHVTGVKTVFRCYLSCKSSESYVQELI